MSAEISAGVIVFRSRGSAREYLLLRSTGGHWEFPKGHLESGETWQQAAMRELAEEAGINDATPIPGFARQMSYYFNDRKKGSVHKTVAFLLAETRESAVTLSDEHRDFAFLAFEPAIARLTHVSTRSLLREAEAFLQSSDAWHTDEKP